MNRALIVCNGEISEYNFYKNLFKDSYIICADGGTRHLKNFNLVPNMIIGDLDSISDEDLAFYRNKKIEIKKFKCEKDETDSHISLKVAIEKGFKDIYIIGALGTRFDHSIANIMLLEYALEKNVLCKIIDEKNEIQMINDSIKLEKENDCNISLVPLTDYVKGINSSGLYYPHKNMTIKRGETIGISNKFVSEQMNISIESGILIVIKSRD
ncbi:MAG: thiamine diphosphokinase [Clostridiales bacterium]